jgi:hypothetical protein
MSLGILRIYPRGTQLILPISLLELTLSGNAMSIESHGQFIF